MKLGKEELLNLAQLSALKLYDNEIENLITDLKIFLEYTNELDQVKLLQETNPIKNINLFRKDIVIETNSESIKNQVPQIKNDLFVMPAIRKAD